MRIATWNVNSVKQRMDQLVAWLTERSPDIVCLQETKCVDEAFPRYLRMSSISASLLRPGEHEVAVAAIRCGAAAGLSIK